MNTKNNLLLELQALKLFGYKYINKSKQIKSKNIILPNTLEELNNRIKYCNLCELSNFTKQKSLQKNDKNIKLVILVEKKLDEKKYNNLMTLIKKYFNKNDIAILSLIKCNINNTNINNKSYEICKDYTIKEIEILNPRFILSFGKIYKYIINESLNITEKIRYNNSYMYYLNDLDYIQRNPSCIENYTNLFRKIKNEMEKEWDI